MKTKFPSWIPGFLIDLSSFAFIRVHSRQNLSLFLSVLSASLRLRGSNSFQNMPINLRHSVGHAAIRELLSVHFDRVASQRLPVVLSFNHCRD
jgi:hypothetical protein